METAQAITCTRGPWDNLARLRIAEELTLEQHRLPLAELDLELEAVIDALANDLARNW